MRLYMINGLLSGKTDIIKDVNYLTSFFAYINMLSTGFVDNILLFNSIFFSISTDLLLLNMLILMSNNLLTYG